MEVQDVLSPPIPTKLTDCFQKRSIRYPIRTPHDGSEIAPCVIAGPTCDSADVLYEKTPYPLPLSLEIGDELLIEATGAYTSTYASVAFNGFAPLPTYIVGGEDDAALAA